MSIFTATRIHSHITRIDMPYVSAYLIKGQERAVLIDTGWGYGDLKAFVESICDLPYEVILSHGHCDHGGGAGQFEAVYLNEIETDLEHHSCSIETRQNVFRHVMRRQEFEEDLSQWLPQRQKPYKSLTETTLFDLGGITLKPVLVPGHTEGIMGFILPEISIAFFGDACSEPTLVTLASSTSIQAHYQGLLNLQRYTEEFDRVLISHSPFELPKEVLANNIRLAERILAGQDAKAPVKMNGELVYSARERRSKNLSKPLPVGNILYSSKNI